MTAFYFCRRNSRKFPEILGVQNFVERLDLGERVGCFKGKKYRINGREKSVVVARTASWFLRNSCVKRWWSPIGGGAQSLVVSDRWWCLVSRVSALVSDRWCLPGGRCLVVDGPGPSRVSAYPDLAVCHCVQIYQRKKPPPFTGRGSRGSRGLSFVYIQD
jgi:hypothetical protein